MPKVLQINVTSNWGSTGKIAESCNCYARANGWETYFAYGRYSNLSDSSIIAGPSNKIDVYAHYAENILFDNEGLASRRATRQLLKKIEKLQPDIIHLHNIHDHWLNYKILFEYLNQTNIKVVWTFHDFWAITGHCSHFVQANCHKFQTECNDCPYTKGKLLPLIKRTRSNYLLKRQLFTANENIVIVPVSKWVCDNVQKSFLKDKTIKVISNGVDTQVFRPTPMDCIENKECIDRFEGKFVIMAVSSQWKSRDKGLDDYKAMSKMLREDEVIVLVGVSDEIAKDLPMNIIGINRTNNQQELAALYTRADVICSFSLAETFGLTIIEGYACGTPAVVYENTAPPSLITPDTGFVVPNKDIKAAYQAIQIIRIKGKSAYTNACVCLVCEKYNKNDCFNKYVELYESLL